MQLEPWGEGDLWLLERLMGDPAMTEHLGGPESPEKIAERQARYELAAGSGQGGMFKIVDGEPAGSVGYWERDWRDQRIYEIGWMVLPEFQGRGLAAAAAAEVVAMAQGRAHAALSARVPGGGQRRLERDLPQAGFTLVEECEFEYPPGQLMVCNDWRLDLFAGTRRAPSQSGPDAPRASEL